MPDFAYIARDNTGQKVSGSLTAATEREVINILSGRALFPVKVTTEKASAAPGAHLRVRGQTMATVYSQLAALLRSGVPLLRALAVLREQTSNKSLKSILEDVHHRVEDGSNMADAMLRYPKAFNEMAINMVRAGAEGGFLEDALERVASFTENQEELKGRTMGAMAYPLILSVAGTLVVTILIVFFVPKFAAIFQRLRERGELPWMTEALLTLSDTLRGYGILIVIAMAAAGIWIWFQLQTAEGRRMSDVVKLRLPVAGSIFRNLA